MVIQVNIVVVENEENMAAMIEVVVLKDTTIRKKEQPGGTWRTWRRAVKTSVTLCVVTSKLDEWLQPTPGAKI